MIYRPLFRQHLCSKEGLIFIALSCHLSFSLFFLFFFLLWAFAVRRVPPRFSILPTNHEIMPGGSINITCVAVGSPMPYVKWMLNSEDLTPEDDMPVGRNVLELNSVHESANYTCVAMSSLGIIEAVSQVIVKCKRRHACHLDCWTFSSIEILKIRKIFQYISFAIGKTYAVSPHSNFV